ncbi:Two component system histidine kinase, Hpt domain-containing [Desulfonema limicola]|uniref:histidine kinase n=1 Tax=Desulfonema limicola TaxID=45656 RepID=A0A975BE93_9BACT|nr:chemotaxis protein CheA [Desulfonema limicola]QTA83718.1 Two component system histidine kinase, Hpt domain-containing [Desulfonema limicola]
MIHEKELLDEFVADSKEHLDKIEDDFLALEKQKNNPDKKIIDKVFRAVHSIKGAAGFFGLNKISMLAHIMETLLSMIRTGDILPESFFIDGLLSGTDHLKAMLDNVEYSNDADITDIYQKLSNLLENKISSQVKKELNTPVCLSDECGEDIGFDINAFTMKNFSPDMNLHVLKYDLSELDRLEKKRPVMLIRELLSSGEIIDAQIHTSTDDLHADISEMSLLYNVLYASELSSEQIQRVTGLPQDKVIPVQPDHLQTDHLPTEHLQIDHLQIDQPQPEHISHLRIHTDILDRLMALTGELVLVRNQKNLITNLGDPVSRSITQGLNLVTGRLQETVMGIRMQALGIIFNKFPKLINQVSEKLGKKINIDIRGSDVELDKTVLESLADPMVHLIRNCCDHGIETPEQRTGAGKPETGNIFINAWHEAGRINIEIKDDGKGIDTEKICKIAVENRYIKKSDLADMSRKDILSLIFIPGFSTASSVSEVSGRGVGMDVVKTGIEKTGGTLSLESNHGKGTQILLSLPLTLAIIPCLIIKTLKNYYALPQVNVEKLLCLYEKEAAKQIEYTDDRPRKAYREYKCKKPYYIGLYAIPQ